MIIINLKRVSSPTLHIYDIYMCVMCVQTLYQEKMRIWSNGKISLCQGEDAGSIPAIRPK
jgi:hypothetical protein